MQHLDHYERAIIHYLGHVPVATTNQIAENLKISWATVNKKLDRLLSLGYVERRMGPLVRGKEWRLRFK